LEFARACAPVEIVRQTHLAGLLHQDLEREAER
jgi:hypothetical protein